jgi:hypothetical protein
MTEDIAVQQDYFTNVICRYLPHKLVNAVIFSLGGWHTAEKSIQTLYNFNTIWDWKPMNTPLTTPTAWPIKTKITCNLFDCYQATLEAHCTYLERVEDDTLKTFAYELRRGQSIYNTLTDTVRGISQEFEHATPEQTESVIISVLHALPMLYNEIAPKTTHLPKR